MDLITKKIPLKEILEKPSDSLKGFFDKYSIDDPFLVRKGNTPTNSEFIEGEHASIDIWTADVLDRDSEIVIPTGIILDDYRKNPIVLFCHDYHSMPIGRCQWIKMGPKGLLAKTIYYTREGSKGKEVFEYCRDGFPMGTSIGFVPLEIVERRDFGRIDIEKYGLKEEDIKAARCIYLKTLLLEASRVPVPSCPDAIQVCISKGLKNEKNASYFALAPISTEEKTVEAGEIIITNGGTSDSMDIEIKVDGSINITTSEDMIVKEAMNETDSEAGGVLVPEEQKPLEVKDGKYIHIPVEAEAKLHEGHKIRTIVISEEKGIKAIYCVDDKTIISRLFDSEKWTEEEAQKWVDDNVKESKTVSILDVIERLSTSSPPNPTPSEDDNMMPIMESFAKSCVCECGHKSEPDADATCATTPCEKCGTMMRSITYDDDNSLPEEERPQTKDMHVIQHSGNKFGIKRYSDNGIVKIERWNKSLCKSFDITAVPERPENPKNDVISQYLDARIKDVYHTTLEIPHALMPSYLAAHEELTKDYDHHDTRNFNAYMEERPLVYDTMKCNSKTERDFLISGTEFMHTETGNPVAITRMPGWGTIDLHYYSHRDNKDAIKALIKATHDYVDNHNFLKGENFSLSGEFIDSTNDDWDDIFIKSELASAAKRTVKNLNEKGANMPNRGLLFMGKPGTGKTSIGRVMMNQAKDTTFIWLSARDFSYGSVRGLGFAFSMARKLAPSHLFIEDIDNWLDAYTTDLIKTEMDGIKKTKGVVTTLTSNYPERLPSAIIDRPGRFHDVLHFDLPDAEMRSKMLKAWVPEENNLMGIVNSTVGFSGAHMRELVDFAKSICEEDGCSMVEALQKSLDKLKEQRQLIEDMKSGRKKCLATIEEEFASVAKIVKPFVEIEEKQAEIIDIEFEAEAEKKDIEYSAKDVAAMVKLALEKTVMNIIPKQFNIDEMIEESLKKARGIMF